MKKNVFVLAFVSIFLATILIIHVGAGYFSGCSDCGGVVTATCTGAISGSPRQISHKYGGFLGFGTQTCYYLEHFHYTSERCHENSSHVHPGDTVYAYTNHQCGQADMYVCSVGDFAYESINP